MIKISVTRIHGEGEDYDVITAKLFVLTHSYVLSHLNHFVKDGLTVYTDPASTDRRLITEFISEFREVAGNLKVELHVDRSIRALLA